MIQSLKKIQARTFLILVLFVLILFPLQAQTNRRHRMYDAYVSGNRAKWVQIVHEMEHSSEPKSLAWKLELAEY